jgi:hypothetical protein
MPSRHISPRSFDEILSELGDDPAIPDPHGIRKTERPKTEPEDSKKQPKKHFNIESLKDSGGHFQIHKLGAFLGWAACLIGLSILLFIAYKSINSSSLALAEDTQKKISDLQEELALIRSDFQNDQDDLYEAIDILEVSIHLQKENKVPQKVIAKVQPLSHEAELRRWRYLGTSQMGSIQQAFFQVGKHSAAFEKGALTLGDWRLTQVTKENAILTHPQGKSIVLKPFQTE